MKDYIKFKLKPVKYEVTKLFGDCSIGDTRTAFVVVENLEHEFHSGVALLFHPAMENNYCASIEMTLLGSDGVYRSMGEFTYLNLDDEEVSADSWDWEYWARPGTLTTDKNTRNTKNEGDNMKDYVEELLEGKGIHIKEEFQQVLEDLHHGESIVANDVHGVVLQFFFSEGLVESNENSELSLTEKGKGFAKELFGVPVSIEHNQYCIEQIIAHTEEALNFVSEVLPPCSDRLEEIDALLQDVYNVSHAYIRDLKNKVGERNE